MSLDVSIYLDDFDDLSSGYQTYLADLQKLIAEGNTLADICFCLATSLQRNVARLNSVFAEKRTPTVLNAAWQGNVLVFVGYTGTRLFTRRIGDKSAVVIDLDLLLRLVLLIHLIGLDNDDNIVAPTLAGFLLLSIVVPRDEEFPCLYELLISTSKGKTRLINDLFRTVGNFILFHELGHIYTNQYGDDFLRAVFEFPSGVDLSPADIQSIQIHPNSPIYNQIDLPGHQNGLLILSPLLEHWKKEFSSDIFAAYADVLTRSDENPRAVDLEGFVSDLTCWQMVLFAIGNREQYMWAVASGGTITDRSHPLAHARIDILIHHLNFLAEEFAPEWQSPTITLLKSQYDSLWAEDLLVLLQDSTEYVRYGFDETGEHVNVGKTKTFTGGPVPYTPSSFSTLERFFLKPLLLKAERTSWNAAILNGKEQHIEFLNSFTLNNRPIIVELGNRLRKINLKLISEDRE